MRKTIFFIMTVLCFSALSKEKPNQGNFLYAKMHPIEVNDETGFALYRTSKPSRKDVRQFCEMGIEEMVVLSGNAEKYELKYKEECPTLKIIYNHAQEADEPVTSSFLEFFDNWVADAKAKGKKIAFRCNCGCHRTGRLAGYYQMKYQNLTYQDALIIMKKHGKWMWTQKQLYPQLQALEDYIKGRPCSVKEKHCVVMD